MTSADEIWTGARPFPLCVVFAGSIVALAAVFCEIAAGAMVCKEADGGAACCKAVLGLVVVEGQEQPGPSVGSQAGSYSSVIRHKFPFSDNAPRILASI